MMLHLPILAGGGTGAQWRTFLRSAEWAAVVAECTTQQQAELELWPRVLTGWQQLWAVAQWERHVEEKRPTVTSDARGGRLIHPQVAGIAAPVGDGTHASAER